MTQTEIVQQVVNQTVLELPLQVEVLSMNALNKTAFRIQVASMLGVPLYAISLDLGASRRRLEHPGPARARRLVALDLIVTIMGAPAVDIAGAESLWKSKKPTMLHLLRMKRANLNQRQRYLIRSQQPTRAVRFYRKQAY